MPKPTKIKASELVIDHNVYPRQSIDDTNIRALAEALEAGATLPPIVADKTSKVVSDGVHRLRAYQRVHGDDVTVDVDLRTYASSADLFADAVSMNADHGRRLTHQDHSRIVLRAEQLGITVDRVAGLLHVPTDKLEKRTLVGKTAPRRPTARAPRGTATMVPLKHTLAHLNGQTLTVAQVDANTKAGGMSPTFYARQLVMLADANALDLDDEVLLQELARLNDRLDGMSLPGVDD